MKKSDLPEKNCIVCCRPFKWRKKWERCWDQVIYCSDKCKKQKRLNMINNYLPDLDWINLRQWEYYTIQIDWLLSNKIDEEDKQALIKIYNEYNHSNKVIPIQLQEYITSLHKDNQLDKYSESSGDPLNEYKKVLLVASILRRQSLGISKINAINMSAKYFNISPKIYFDIFDIYLSRAERFLMVEPDIRGLDKLLGVN
jgi:hypothetical protein